MKLTIGAGELSLPEDFSFEVESNHPFFSDEGTASVPVTIPASAENLRLLDYPENAHRPRRLVREQMAYLTAGSFRRRCKLITESAGKASGISASLAFLESEMYTDLQDRRVPDLFAGKSFFMTRSAYFRPTDIYQGRTRDTELYGNTLYDVAIFPVATDMDSSGKVVVVNSPKSDGTLEDSARPVSINGQTVSVPAGYGISIFMYLWALIEGIFTNAGYTVKNNPFRTDTVLKNIVVVNNCADMCCADTYSSLGWGFCYADLAPDMTVGELLECLHDAFGAYVTCDAGTVDIRLVKDDITADPDADLSGYARDEDSVSYPEPYNLKRSFDTSLDKAEPAAETLQDLRNKYETVANVATETSISGTGLFHVNVLGRYFYKQTSSAAAITLGSDCLSYYRELNMEPEELSTDNRFLPMIKVGTRYMPYIGNRIHKYLEVAKSEDKVEQPLQFCYAHLYSRIDAETSETESWYCGSSYSYYENGLLATDDSVYPKTYPALTPEGFNSYWRDYETLLVNGAPDMEVSLDIPMGQLMQINRFTPKIYKGSKVLIKSLSYTVDDSEMACIKAVLWVLSECDDDIYIPPTILFGVKLEWRLVSTKEANWPANTDSYLKIPDGLEDYTSSDAPETKPSSAGIIAKKRTRWIIFTPLIPGDSFLFTWEEYFISVLQG